LQANRHLQTRHGKNIGACAASFSLT
jgi:hypothetical protein